MQLYVPAAAGLEAVVKRQLKKLGYEDTRAVNGRIALSGEWEDVARLNSVFNGAARGSRSSFFFLKRKSFDRAFRRRILYTLGRVSFPRTQNTHGRKERFKQTRRDKGFGLRLPKRR